MSMSRSAAQLLLLDDPQEWSAFGRLHSPAAPAGPADPATVWESQVVLEGMHCAACALTSEDALRAVPGGLQVLAGRAASRLPRHACGRCLGARAAPARKPPGALALAGGGLLHDAGDDVCVAGLCRRAG